MAGAGSGDWFVPASTFSGVGMTGLHVINDGSAMMV
jgi:hypothetical protein